MEPKMDIRTAWERYVANVPSDENAINRVAFHLLRRGEAPSISEVAGILDLTIKKCQELLEAMSAKGSVTVEEDIVTGAGGLSVIPTSHQINLKDVRLYCWCALDAIGIPAALAEDAEITTVDGFRGDQIHLRFEAGHLIEAPPSLYLQLAPPDQARPLCGGT
ncbi:MAG: organomercurial lyase [Actinomycetota bacterium]|nr:organomercurial lyase [Actinomycetota bacterium]